MEPGKVHVSDGDLIRAADGELSPWRAVPVRRHLKRCWLCRARAAELERSANGFVEAYRSALDGLLPAASVLPVAVRRQLGERPALRLRRLQWRWAASSLAAVLMFVLAYSGQGSERAEPKSGLTPGEAQPTALRDVCANHPGSNRPVSAALRDQVFRAYGIEGKQASAYEVDYLITPALGGADSLRNLWPQPYSARWNAHVKDALEDRLHDLVCAGKLDLATAQKEIATDWIGAYKKYFATDRPLPVRS